MTGTHVSLGILAGGRATRLGGRDKAWLRRDGLPQVVRIAHCFEGRVDRILVSANLALERYIEAGLTAVVDTGKGAGPIAGIDALMRACRTPWLLTLPVDVIDVNDCLLPTLAAHAGAAGAFAVDDDGIQPLVALWNVAACQAEVTRALCGSDHGIQSLQSRLRFAGAHLAGVRFGNLNTHDDLAAAGIEGRP